MFPIRWNYFAHVVVAVMPLASVLVIADAHADSANSGQPLLLDTQHGITDGKSGTVLQNAPLSRAAIVSAQPAVAPTELSPNAQTPIIVAPYVEVPAGGRSPQPRAHIQSHPVSPPPKSPATSAPQ
jgi:hypothetical protein